MRLGKTPLLTRRPKGNRSGIWVALVFFIVLFSGVVYYLFTVMRPTFLILAQNRARELAVEVISHTVAEKIERENFSYDDVVSLEWGENKKISALKSDLSAISRFQTELNREIANRIGDVAANSLSVPLGSLTGSVYLAGMGPEISFRVRPYGNAVCDIVSDFTEAGINQTKLEVCVTVSVDLAILFPTAQKTENVQTTVPLVQTVIVGEIPESYTNVDREGLAYEDDVLQLAE